MSLTHPEKILIIRLSSIGDIVLTTPVIRQLRQRYPQARVDFAVRKEYASLLEANPWLSNLLILDTRDGKPGLSRLRNRISSTGYDVIIDLHRNLRSIALCRFSGAPPILKIKKHKLARFFLVKTGWDLYSILYGTAPSIGEKYLRAAAALGLDPSDSRPELHLPPPAMQRAADYWRELEQRNISLLIAPGARHFTKRWPAECYAQLIRQYFQHSGCRTLLLGGPDEVELAEEIVRQAGADCCETAAGKLSLAESCALIKQAGVFVSNDSGLMHVAAASGIRQIALFGSTTRQLGFFPQNSRATILEVDGLSCRPCSHIGRDSCPQKHFRCMLDLPVARVLDSLTTRQ